MVAEFETSVRVSKLSALEGCTQGDKIA